MEETTRTVYLITVKDTVKKSKPTKEAYKSLKKAMASFNDYYEDALQRGYTGTKNAIYNGESYCKTAKLTLGNDTIRISLEDITFIGDKI